MTTWESRMALRAATRRAAAEAEAARLETEDQARLSAGFPAVKGEGDVIGYGGHRGHRSHMHETHGGGVQCSCGATLGVVCVVIDFDAGTPGPCPVCAARGLR